MYAVYVCCVCVYMYVCLQVMYASNTLQCMLGMYVRMFVAFVVNFMRVCVLCMDDTFCTYVMYVVHGTKVMWVMYLYTVCYVCMLCVCMYAMYVRMYCM